MYLHLGSGAVVRSESIVAVFDLDNTSQSHLTRKFLSQAEKNGCVINVADDIPKSFIVCEENGRIKVYLSQLSPQTLNKRNSEL